MYQKLQPHLVAPEFRTLPHTRFSLVAEGDDLGLGGGSIIHEPGQRPGYSEQRRIREVVARVSGDWPRRSVDRLQLIANLARLIFLHCSISARCLQSFARISRDEPNHL